MVPLLPECVPLAAQLLFEQLGAVELRALLRGLLQELLEVLGFEPAAVITPTSIFASDYFLIRSAGLLDESAAHLEVVVDRSGSFPRVLYWRSN